MNYIEFTIFVCFMAFLFGLSQGLTEITVEFGQNVTLNCSLDAEEIYWFTQRKSEPPVNILRSFGVNEKTSVYNMRYKEFKNKYSLQTFARLFIQNVTRNELGSYYCAKKNLTFGKGITLLGKGAKRYATLKKRNTSDEQRGQSDSALYSEVVLSAPPGAPIRNIDNTYSLLQPHGQT